MNKVLITGASGFIGGNLIHKLIKEGFNCIGLSSSSESENFLYRCDLSNKELLYKLMGGVDCVIHCAGYAHAFSSSSEEILKRTWSVNFDGTRNLLDAAVKAGVKKFIFLSTVKAMSDPGPHLVNESWPCNPNTEYGKSKLAAEKVSNDFSRDYGLNVISLRLAMVYGRGSRGNLERMGRLIRAGIFPPLPETNNHRSMVHIDDVLMAIAITLHKSMPSGEAYIISGPDSPSGREIYEVLCRFYGFPPSKLAIPVLILRFAGCICDCLQFLLQKKLPFNSEVLSRLIDSAWYSSKKFHEVAGWKPAIKFAEGLARN